MENAVLVVVAVDVAQFAAVVVGLAVVLGQFVAGDVDSAVGTVVLMHSAQLIAAAVALLWMGLEEVRK